MRVMAAASSGRASRVVVAVVTLSPHRWAVSRHSRTRRAPPRNGTVPADDWHPHRRTVAACRGGATQYSTLRRQGDREGGAAAEGALCIHCAAVGADNVLDDRQAQAGALAGAGTVRDVEALEDAG